MASQGQNENAVQGETIEQHRARVRGSDAEHMPGEWFDLMDGWTVVEVKSTTRRLGSGRRGRWRLWKGQHEKMVEQGGEYDLVVIEDDEIWRSVTISADEVTEVIEDNDLSWTNAGDSHSMPTEQVKIPWKHVINT